MSAFDLRLNELRLRLEREIPKIVAAAFASVYEQRDSLSPALVLDSDSDSDSDLDSVVGSDSASSEVDDTKFHCSPLPPPLVSDTTLTSRFSIASNMLPALPYDSPSDKPVVVPALSFMLTGCHTVIPILSDGEFSGCETRESTESVTMPSLFDAYRVFDAMTISGNCYFSLANGSLQFKHWDPGVNKALGRGFATGGHVDFVAFAISQGISPVELFNRQLASLEGGTNFGKLIKMLAFPPNGSNCGGAPPARVVATPPPHSSFVFDPGGTTVLNKEWSFRVCNDFWKHSLSLLCWFYTRTFRNNNGGRRQLLLQWHWLPEFEQSWEDEEHFGAAYANCDLEDKVKVTQGVMIWLWYHQKGLRQQVGQVSPKQFDPKGDEATTQVTHCGVHAQFPVECKDLCYRDLKSNNVNSGLAFKLYIDFGLVNLVDGGNFSQSSTLVAAYKMCLPGDIRQRVGNYDAYILVDFEATISNGVDVLSVSVGGKLYAVANGIVLVSSGGNDGPYIGTAFYVAPWLFMVAASTLDKEYYSGLIYKQKRHFHVR